MAETVKEKDVLVAEVMPTVKHCDYDEWQPNPGVDEERKKQILDKYMASGESLSAVAIRHGIDRRTLQRWLAEKKEDQEVYSQVDDMQLGQLMTDKIFQLCAALDKNKFAKASVKDIAIAVGILSEKRREAIGPRSGAGETTLKIAWQNGSGAVELKTGQR